MSTCGIAKLPRFILQSKNNQRQWNVVDFKYSAVRRRCCLPDSDDSDLLDFMVSSMHHVIGRCGCQRPTGLKSPTRIEATFWRPGLALSLACVP